MCGRYTLTAPAEVLTEIFEVSEAVELQPRYNVAPTQEVAVVGLNKAGQRSLGTMKWGLVPSWAKDPAIGNKMLNARSETAAEKPAFRSSFKSRRCLMPATGFFEWKKLAAGKQPYLIRRKDHLPFAFAALWSRWQPPGGGEPLRSCAILTTSPNELMAGIHDRMPVILPAAAYGRWLANDTDPAELQSLLVPCPAEELEAYAVRPLVNSPKNDFPEILAPIGAAG